MSNVFFIHARKITNMNTSYTRVICANGNTEGMGFKVSEIHTATVLLAATQK